MMKLPSLYIAAAHVVHSLLSELIDEAALMSLPQDREKIALLEKAIRNAQVAEWNLDNIGRYLAQAITNSPDGSVAVLFGPDTPSPPKVDGKRFQGRKRPPATNN